MKRKLAYLSAGKLYVQDADAAAEEMTSAFGQDVIQRTLDLHQRTEWKRQGRGSKFMSGGMLWGLDNNDPRALRVHITAVTRGPSPEEPWYALDTDAAGGLFHYRPAPLGERRIFHKERFRARDLDRHPTEALTAFSLHFSNGTAHLAVLEGDGPHFDEITEGDSVDEAPSWVPGEAKTMVFQSAGIGRNAQGFAIGLGPISIQRLDLANARQETLLEDERYDFLLPHQTADGTLYFIRRPYEPAGLPRRGGLQVLKDAVLFPWRLIEAFFHFLNFFSMTFAKKPLTPAGGPKVEGADAQTIYLRGRVLDVQRALREQGQDKEAPALVPKSWQLVRRAPDGGETVLAERVAAFDVAPDGALITTNGSAIFALAPDGTPTRMGKGRLIEHLVALA